MRRLAIALAAMILAHAAHADDRIEDRYGNRIGTVERPSPYSDRLIVRDRKGRITHQIERPTPYSDRMIIRDRRGRIVGNVRRR